MRGLTSSPLLDGDPGVLWEIKLDMLASEEGCVMPVRELVENIHIYIFIPTPGNQLIYNWVKTHPLPRLLHT